MNPKCGKCSKTVYPTELLKCLDKSWHKACFKCTVCGMTLNMKNYKGYDKMPYCNAHYPTTRHTVVADTPENRRIAENTKIQSAVKYHEDFEKQKGSKTSVAEDPEIARIRQNTANQSNVSYWGVREQRNIMESKRPNEQVDEVVSRRQPGKISDYDPAVDQPSPYSQRSSANVVYDSQKGGIGEIKPQGSSSQRSSTHSYAPFSYGGTAAPSHPTSSSSSPSNRHSGGSNGRNSYGGDPGQDPNQPRSSTNRLSGGAGYGTDASYNAQQNRSGAYGQTNIGGGYNNQRPYSYGNPPGNPMPHVQASSSSGNQHHHYEQIHQQGNNSPRTSSGFGNARNSGGGSGGVGYSYTSGGGGGGGSGGGSYHQHQHRPASGHHHQQQQQQHIQGQRVQPGSIADYDPMNERHSSVIHQNQHHGGAAPPSGGGSRNSGGYQQQQYHQPEPPMSQPPPQPEYQPPPPQQMPPAQPKQPAQIRYRAIYDYSAADDDEVSFVEGDLITNCEIIDEGWMTGVVMRTGQQGMLPSNYVERD